MYEGVVVIVREIESSEVWLANATALLKDWILRGMAGCHHCWTQACTAI